MEKIEADAEKRIGSDPHAEGVIETGLGLLLFEAARLSSEPAGGAGTRPTRSRRRPSRDRKRKSAPATGSVVAGAGTEG